MIMKAFKHWQLKNNKSLAQRLSRYFAIAAVLALVIGVVASINESRTNTVTAKHAALAVALANKGVNNGTPTTTPVTDNAFNNYHVPPTQPRYIYIPKLNVKAMVLSLGVTKTNQIQAPPNIYQAGWYRQSSLPGGQGAMLIDGHVSSWTAHGIFYGLKTLVVNDVIQIQRGDGSLLTYKVVKSQTYGSDNVDMTALLSPINLNRPGLNLITCTGSVKSGTNDFNDRVVVFAEQVQDGLVVLVVFITECMRYNNL